MSVAPLQFLLLVFAGWVNRRQLELLAYLQEENRVLREQLGDRRVRFTDAQRRRLAAKGRVLGRRVLEQLAGLVTPDTILRWYRELIAKKYDGTAQRTGSRRGTTASPQRLVVRFATENPSWGYTRIRGALRNSVTSSAATRSSASWPSMASSPRPSAARRCRGRPSSRRTSA
jgi:hypothetical protein